MAGRLTHYAKRVLMLGGLNPVAAAEEAGIPAENAAICSVVEYSQLRSFWDL